jgi:16S rRNA (guanine527-N7)-methyltransferase
MSPPTDHTFERLLVEPLLAAQFVPASARIWFDFGSGGGSPAIPMKVACAATHLTMVEIKTRKAAFLREVARTLALENADVADEGFQAVSAATDPATVDLVTVRALRIDEALFSAVDHLLSPQGSVMLFHSNATKIIIPAGFEATETAKLQPLGSSVLTIVRRMFHVEHRH